MEYDHKPVLLDQCIDALNIKPDGVYLDGTLGGGGHSLEILKRLGNGGRLISLDRDKRALNRAGRRLEQYGSKLTLVHANFKDIGAVLDELSLHNINGMLFDLGVSSPQLDEAERGFSYMTDAPLDMRMDESEALTAEEIVNSWPEEDLRRIIYEYGEERYAAAISRRIAAVREKKKIDTTLELSDIIRSAMPAAALRERQHPAKRSFQAIRIAVNRELDAIARMMDTAADYLVPGGRLCVISFHSLEDRIVKNAIAKREKGCTCPRDFPVCVCGFKPTLKNIWKKPVIPAAEEIAENPRARSAKLRVAQRV